MTDRDKLILQFLHHFRVLSRDQIGSLVCSDVSRPFATVNRIMLRLVRDGRVLQIPQPKDQCYLYMPNPALIHTQSSKTKHFLGIVDYYIQLGKPEVYHVEPEIPGFDYRPDVAAIVDGEKLLIEYQRSHTSSKVIQTKVDNFAKSFPVHGCRTLWIVTDRAFKIQAPEGFQVLFKPLTPPIQKGPSLEGSMNCSPIMSFGKEWLGETKVI